MIDFFEAMLNKRTFRSSAIMTDNNAGPGSSQSDASGKDSANSSSSSSDAVSAPIPEGLKTALLSSRVAASTVVTENMHNMLRALTSTDFNQRLLALIQAMLRGQAYQRVFKAFGAYIVAHPWQVAGLIIGTVLIANPLALAGFGAMGPVAGALYLVVCVALF